MLDLVIALSHTRHRMTKAQIRRHVNGYDAGGSTEAFERMFERDKETLRQLGIPLVTLTDAVHEDEVGYRIDTAAYQLPPIDLSPAQMGVLSLAAEVNPIASTRRGPAEVATSNRPARALGSPCALPTSTCTPWESTEVTVAVRLAMGSMPNSASPGPPAGRMPYENAPTRTRSSRNSPRAKPAALAAKWEKRG